MITHELNTPLSVVRMMTDSLRRDLNRLNTEQITGYLDLLVRSSDELTYIVESMLLALQIDSGHSQAVFDTWAATQQVQTLIDNALSRVSVQVSERLIRVRLSGDLQQGVYGHEERICSINRGERNLPRVKDEDHGQLAIRHDKLGAICRRVQRRTN